ncbi:MAG: hypothetical protein Q4D26_10855 [Clostridia bacterium]|nr:hypothetical protein [Clostridia bacterium]
MKKSSFVAMVLGTISGVLFAIGMCMALIPEWGTMKPGIIFGCVGVILGIITLIIWRKMTGKEPIKIYGKAVFTSIVGIIGALALGVGMCFTMVWDKMVLGIVIGLIGIVILLCLIPLIKGIKD